MTLELSFGLIIKNHTNMWKLVYINPHTEKIETIPHSIKDRYKDVQQFRDNYKGQRKNCDLQIIPARKIIKPVSIKEALKPKEN